MLTAGILLISLSVHTVYSDDPTPDPMYINYEDYTTDVPNITVGLNDWLIDILDWSNACEPNPCFNGGSCRNNDTKFECLCIEPYMGKRCQKVRNVCENVKCGLGDCVVNLKKPPFHKCKCKPPYRGQDCRTLPESPCDPNPCQNGGSCKRGTRRFRCICPDTYTGTFCEIAPTDCYVGYGDTYRGTVSTTEDGKECLDWRSNFILLHGDDPFEMYSGEDLESNHCRNPDGDNKPWCFFKKQNKLQWEYCRVKKCPDDATILPTTPSIPPTTATPAALTTPAAPGTVKPDPNVIPFSQCGVSQPSHTSRIYGGSKSFPGAHPWQVSVQAKPRFTIFSFDHICGGILLTSCWVLTAAHCVNPDNELQVVLGGVNIDKQEEMDQTIPVIQTIVHENFRESHDALYNDIALLRLNVTDSPYCAKETRFVKTVCLPDQTFAAGKQCVISGWGETETQRRSSQLLNARVLLISEQQCKASHIYGKLVDSGMLCAGNLQGGIDSCQGDSGGPLVCEHNGTHYITGVVSWGDGCGEKNKPGVYTNIHTFIDWIKTKIK